MNFRIFDLYAVASNFAFNFAHNLTGYNVFYRCFLFLSRLFFYSLFCRANQSHLTMIMTIYASCDSEFFFALLGILILYFLSSEKSYLLIDDSDELWSDSRSSGTYYFCAFYLRFEESECFTCLIGINTCI